MDGWDEAFVTWGREDSDFAARLINSGVGRKEGRYAIPILHLYHPWEDKSTLDAADARLGEVLEKGITHPRTGISSHKLGADH